MAVPVGFVGFGKGWLDLDELLDSPLDWTLALFLGLFLGRPACPITGAGGKRVRSVSSKEGTGGTTL